MIPLSQAEQMVAEAVAKAVGTLEAKVLQMQAALDQAKQIIAKLQTTLYGTRAETSQVVLPAAGQEFIDPTWMKPQDTTPAPPAPTTETVTRTPRDRRGLAQKHPHLSIEETEAPLPPELAEQVKAGALIAQRSTRFHDELVVSRAKPFLRRVFEMDLVKPSTGAVALQIAPDRIVPGGDLADETIHGLVEGKALDATPFHRQLAQVARAGVEIPKQTANDAINAWGDLFAPLAAIIAAQVLACAVVHADASWKRLQAEGACKRLHLWTRLGGGQVAYTVTEDLRHERATELIPPDFTGKLITDAWPGWLKLPLGDRLGLCNAHARRPFADWLKRDRYNPHAKRVVELYRSLARIEHQAAEGPPDDLLARRQRLRDQASRPLMADLKAEAERIVANHPGSHQLADGARYILDYWEGLTRFLDQPDLPPDNNNAENALRINALIRKNSLFVGSLPAAHRDAVALTVFHSCRLQRLLPANYLARVTPALLLHRRGRAQDLARLTPAAVAATR